MIKKIVVRCVLITVSVAMSLVVLEFFLKDTPFSTKPIVSVHNYSQFNIAYGIEPKPKLNYEEYGVRVKTNSHATFGPELKTDKTLSIFHLGDSYSAGPGIAYKKNYPYLLQEKINAQSSSKYQSVILGMGGSSPLQQAYIYKKKLTNLRPSLTIYELYQNDLGDDYIFYYSGYRAKIQSYEAFPKILLQSKTGNMLFTFLSDQLSKRYVKKYEETKDIISKDPKYVWDLTMKNGLNEIKTISEEKKSPLIIFYIPSGWDFDNEYASAPAKLRDSWPAYVEKWARQNNIPYYNFYSDFKEQNTEQLNELYLDIDHGYHLTEKGTKIVADKLFEIITQYGYIK